MKKWYGICVAVLGLAAFMAGCSLVEGGGSADLTVTLPYNSAGRAAALDAYIFEVAVENENGDTVRKRGKSGETISFSVIPGTYTVKGEAWEESGSSQLYHGEAKAVAQEGIATQVPLSLSNLSETEHVSASAFKDGVQITVKRANDEVNWKTGGGTYIDVFTETGMNGRIGIKTLPSPDESLTYYYPFSSQGERIWAELSIETDTGSIKEEFGAVSGGGLDLLSGEDVSGITASISTDGVVRLSGDPTPFIKADKLTAFSNIYFEYNVWGVTGSEYEWSNWMAGSLDKVMYVVKDGTVDRSDFDDFLKNGRNAIDDALALCQDEGQDWMLKRYFNHSKCFASVENTMEFAEYPNQTLSVGIGGFMSPISPVPTVSISQSAHVKAEPCNEGVKLTFTHNDSDDEWSHITVSVPDQFIMDFDGTNATPFPSAGGSGTAEIVFPLLTKGQTYLFTCELSIGNDRITEVVTATAGGGIHPFSGTPSDITMTLDDDGIIRFSTDPTSIFSPLSQVNYFSIYIQFYGANTWSSGEEWNYLGEKQFYYSVEDGALMNFSREQMDELLEDGFDMKDFIETATDEWNNGGAFYKVEAKKYPYCWLQGGVKFNLAGYEGSSFQFNGTNFSTENNIFSISMLDLD